MRREYIVHRITKYWNKLWLYYASSRLKSGWTPSIIAWRLRLPFSRYFRRRLSGWPGQAWPKNIHWVKAFANMLGDPIRNIRFLVRLSFAGPLKAWGKSASGVLLHERRPEVLRFNVSTPRFAFILDIMTLDYVSLLFFDKFVFNTGYRLELSMLSTRSLNGCSNVSKL